MSLNHNADIVFLYGPAGSGKGTQAGLLLEQMPERKSLDYGKELREFNEQYIDKDGFNGDMARRMDSAMKKGNPVDPKDLEIFIKLMIKRILNDGEKLIIDGAWRTVGEAEWLSEFLSEEGITTTLVQIHISQEEAVKRATGRWLVPGSSKPYPTREEAAEDCPADEEPYQRYDDQNADTVIERYSSMYGNHWAKVVQIYQTVTGQKHCVIDGAADIDEVAKSVQNCLENKTLTERE